MVLRPKVIFVLQDFLEGAVEILPIIHPEEELYFGNVINVVDCLDREKSQIKYIGDRINVIKKYAFINSKLDNIHIFTLPEKPGSHIFVSDKIKNRVEEAKLKGFDFEEVWDTSVTDDMREEQTRKYNEMIEAIEQSSNLEMTFDEAYRLVESGRAVASGKWKLQVDAKGRVLLGQLNEDCTYAWIDPMYIPPILLGLKWREVEKSPMETPS